MNPICFFHRSDLDGACSAAIVKHFVPDCELYGMDYGDEFPWDKVRPGPDAANDPLWAECFKPENGYVAGEGLECIPFQKRPVYLVDFSLKPDDMKRLAEISDLCWCDHHKTALEANKDLQCSGGMTLNTKFAACELTWAKMSNGDAVHVPEAVRLLGRYDVWDNSDKTEWDRKILPYQYAMRSQAGIYKPDAFVWLCILGGTAPDGQEVKPWACSPFFEQGNAILRYLGIERAEKANRGAFEAVVDCGPNFDGRRYVRALCMNTSDIGSASFDSVWDPENYDVMLMFVQLKSGKWRHGIYTTRDDVDCSLIAKAFGGGGHRKAAGCETSAPIVKPATGVKRV